MDQKQKMIALLASAGILAGGAIGYILFVDQSITKEVAYQIESASGSTSTGTVIATDATIAYVSSVEGTVKLNRKGNEAVLKQNDTLESTDTIATDAGSAVEIIFADNSFLRLAESSKLALSGTNQVDLESGSLWARILKPFQDTSVFTINASDLSAGVRGTAVYVNRTQQETSVRVIDTTAGTGSAVDVQVKTASGTVQENLKNEESLTLRNQESEKSKLNMDQLLQDEFVITNLKKDIVLMHAITLGERTSSGTLNPPLVMQSMNREQLEKINQEIIASLPKNNELNKFFQSSVIEDEARQLPIFSRALSGSTQLTQEQQIQLLITFTTDDMQLNQLEKDLKKMRSTANDFTDDTQKQEYQKRVNQLEQDIREFDINWAKKERARIEQAKIDAARLLEQTEKLEGEAPVTETGTGATSASGSTILVPNTGVRSTLTGSTITPLPTAPTTPVAPVAPIAPKPIVSGTAIPKTSTTTVVPKTTTTTTTTTTPIVSGTAIPR